MEAVGHAIGRVLGTLSLLVVIAFLTLCAVWFGGFAAHYLEQVFMQGWNR